LNLPENKHRKEEHLRKERIRTQEYRKRMRKQNPELLSMRNKESTKKYREKKKFGNVAEQLQACQVKKRPSLEAAGSLTNCQRE
jgi:septal ring factor EnvC (AmiA/AmiB activator)